MRHSVRPKKHLGQHFLKDTSIAERIANSISAESIQRTLIEIGPGTGALTVPLLQRQPGKLFLAEVDQESIRYLQEHFPELRSTLLQQNFLTLNLSSLSSDHIAVVGNFPYNISTQILFKVLEDVDKVKEIAGMFQKEVAERIVASPGSKTYGILSVLLQLFYKGEYLFTVEPEAFLPPPKVKSGVVRFIRNDFQLDSIPFSFLKTVVKTAFNQRRKTLRNALKPLVLSKEVIPKKYIGLRAEQLSPTDFLHIAVALHQQ